VREIVIHLIRFSVYAMPIWQIVRYLILSIHVHCIWSKTEAFLFSSWPWSHHFPLQQHIYFQSFSKLHVYTISLLTVDRFKSNWVQKNVSKFILKSKLREMIVPQDSRNIYMLFCFVMVHVYRIAEKLFWKKIKFYSYLPTQAQYPWVGEQQTNIFLCLAPPVNHTSIYGHSYWKNLRKHQLAMVYTTC